MDVKVPLSHEAFWDINPSALDNIMDNNHNNQNHPTALLCKKLFP